MQTIRIFVSSPGDVEKERERAMQVIQGLQQRYAQQFQLEPVLWENMPLSADQSFQQGIDLVLSEKQGIDIAVFILWSRFGSPSGPTIRKSDGSEYLSGTEREFDLMKQACMQSRREFRQLLRPRMLMYVRRDDASFDELLKGKPTDKQSDLVKQKQLAEGFVNHVLNDSESGANSGAYHVYKNPVKFSEKLREHLRDLLDEMLTDEQRQKKVNWDTDTKGPPFVALDAFQPKQADIFFGREEEIINAREAMHKQALNGCTFLLLCGASGSGKSSLARAGVLPSIVTNERTKENPVWRTLIVKPSELVHALSGSGRTLIDMFVDRLVDPEVLPELLIPGVAKSDLADLLRRNPDDAVKQRFKPAFVAIGQRESQEGHEQGILPSARLLLLIDQLEELFTTTAITDADCEVFLAIVEALAKSRDVWVLATVRSDFYQEMQKKPALIRMKGSDGMIDVLPPTADALRHIIEDPASLSGLRFQKDENDKSLSDKILKDAASHSELLPLVEYVLWKLYDKAKKRDEKELRFEDYMSPHDPDDYNGVENALIKKADEVFNSLYDNTTPEQGTFTTREDAECAVDFLLKSLVTVNEDATTNKEVIVRRYSSLESTFPAGSSERKMVDAFVTARLLTASKDRDSGKAVVAVAHESLLRVWPRATEWVDSHRVLLRIRSRLDGRIKEGISMLGYGPLLSAASEKLNENPTDFNEEQRKLITNSIFYHKRRKWAIRGAALAVSLIIFSMALYYTYSRGQVALAGQLFAEADGHLFKKDYARAEIMAAKSLAINDDTKTRDLLLKAKSGSISLVFNSSQKMPSASLSQFSWDGQLIASVLNDNHGKPIAVAITSSSDGKEKWRINLSPSESMPDSMTFSDNNGQPRLLAIAWSNHGVSVWSLSDGKPAMMLRELSTKEHRCEHTKRVPSMVFHPSKPWLVTSSEDKRLCLWDYSKQTAQLIWEKEDAHDTAIHGIAFNVDGSLLASGGGDYKVKIWKTEYMAEGYDGQPSNPDHNKFDPWKTMAGHTDSVFAVAFSPDGYRLASGGYDRVIRVWNLDDLEDKNKQLPTVGTLSGHEGTVVDISFSEDSKLLISSGKDKAARIWDVSGSRVLATLTPENGIIRSVAWRNFEDDIHLGGENGWSIWSARGNKVITRLWNGGATIGTIAFDPAGHFLTVAGDDGIVRIWGNGYHTPQPLDSGLKGESINALAISIDSRWLAAAGERKTVHLWKHGSDWNSWKKVMPSQGSDLTHEGAIWGLCFDPKGRWLYSSNTDNNRRINRWNINDWSLLDQSVEMSDTIYSMACDPEGTRLIGGDSAGQVTVFDTKDFTVKAKIKNVEHGEANVWSVAVSSNPSYIFTGNSDGHVYRWIPNDSEWTGGKKEERISSSDKDATVNPTINSVSFSQKHGWVAAGGDGSSIEIYDVDLKHVQSLEGHDGTIWYVAFDPQGTRLAYGGSDRILRIFNLDEVQNLISSSSPKELYQEAQKMTGFSVEKEKNKNIVVSYQDR